MRVATFSVFFYVVVKIWKKFFGCHSLLHKLKTSAEYYSILQKIKSLHIFHSGFCFSLVLDGAILISRIVFLIFLTESF